MKNETLAERMRLFKETKMGQRELSGIELDIAESNWEGGRQEGRQEGLEEAKTDMAAKLILLGQMSLEAIAEVSGLPIEQLREIKSNLSLSV